MAHDEIPEWVRGWDEYRRTLDEDAEERAYEAGFRRGRASAMERGQCEPVPGTVQWAVTQILAGRLVKRRGGNHVWGAGKGRRLSEQHGIMVALEGFLATDWELAETPDSPCDCP